MVKLLESERYHELVKFPELKDRQLDPTTSIVVVSEEDGNIKGYWIAHAVVHIEPTNLKDVGPHARLEMLTLLLSELAARGDAQFFAFANDENVVNYLLRLGLVPLDYAVFHGFNPMLLTTPEGVAQCQPQ